MRDSNNSYSSFQSGLFMIINELEKISGSICASFRKWFSNHNAPTKAYIDVPRPSTRLVEPHWQNPTQGMCHTVIWDVQYD